MKINMYAIKDRQLDAFMLPFPAQTNGAAIRSFGNHTKEEGHPVAQHPDDYSLYHLGDYDDQVGKMTSLETPVKIAEASDFTK